MLVESLVLFLSFSASAQDAPAPAAKPETRPAAKEDAVLETVRKFIDEQIGARKIDKSQSAWKTRLPQFPAVSFRKEARYFWNLDTNKGKIKVRFFPDVAPNHVANFVYLTELGFFDGLTFHRVMERFMAQGGCPQGDGRGSPGYRFDGEFKPGVSHDRPGLLSMANAGPGTDGSQFFITFAPTQGLDGKHTIFGEVAGDEGAKTLKALEAAAGSRETNGVPPKERLEIRKATITTE